MPVRHASWYARTYLQRIGIASQIKAILDCPPSDPEVIQNMLLAVGEPMQTRSPPRQRLMQIGAN